MTLRIGILVYDQFDLIDGGGPYEVFLTASRLRERDGEGPVFEVILISPDGADVTAFGGMTLTNLVAPADAGDLDVLVVSGIVNLDAVLGNGAVMEAVRMLAERAELVTSVCTGAFILGDVGLLAGLPATTHWEDVDALTERGTAASVSATHRWVDAGDVVTSGGLTSGMHMALHVVGRLTSVDLAERTARQLDLPWDPEGTRG